VADFFANGGQQAIVTIPVGCGKSGLICILPFGVAAGRVLVIAPNLTIKDELRKNLDITNRRYCFWSKCSVLTPEVMSAGPYLAVLEGEDANIHDCDRSHIVLTNIQQLASSADRWLPQFPDNYFDLILVDEGHHSAAASWKKVFQKFPDAKVVNLTATPFRSDRQELEGQLVYRFSFKQAMLKGYIKRVQAVYVAPDEIYFTYRGDEHRHTLTEVLELKEEDWFSRGVALARECNTHIVEASLEKLENLRRSGTHHQLIAVACSVDHAHQIRSLYTERGYEAAEIYSSMPEDKQKDVLQRLKSGALDCLVHVQMLGEGFDHPQLSIAAIFRPFRSLAPYVQFVGRILRVVVQNDPRHPDNYGYIVSHIGLNTDQLVSDFRDMEREDRDFFELMISGNEPEPPREVLDGRTRERLSADMVVQREVVTELFEDNFLQSDDEALLAELKAQAEAMGFDAEAIDDAVKKIKKSGPRLVKAGEPFPVLPQVQRREARRRLDEEVKRAARLLLNRLSLESGGHEIMRLFGTPGTNFVAAVQLINREVDRLLGIERGRRGTLKTEDFAQALKSLDEVLQTVTRRVGGRLHDVKER